MVGPRIFTVREANSFIPELESIFNEMDEIKSAIKRVKSKIDVLEILWGEEIASDNNPDKREYIHYIEELEKLKDEFDKATKKIAERECFLKSADSELVDFYGVIDGRLVLLCYKRGEKSIEFWHHIEAGFAGRQLIPEEVKLS